MKYNIRGNKIDVTEAIDNYIKEKLSRFSLLEELKIIHPENFIIFCRHFYCSCIIV